MKRCLLASLSVSTAQPDTSEFATPQDVPGMHPALHWAAEEAGVSVQALRDKSEWRPSRVDVSSLVILLSGSGPMPKLKKLDLTGATLNTNELAQIHEALHANRTLESLNFLGKFFFKKDALAALIATFEASRTLKSLCGVDGNETCKTFSLDSTVDAMLIAADLTAARGALTALELNLWAAAVPPDAIVIDCDPLRLCKPSTVNLQRLELVMTSLKSDSCTVAELTLNLAPPQLALRPIVSM